MKDTLSASPADSDGAPAVQPAPDFRTIFESSPDPYLVLSADLTIVAVSEAYLKATMTERPEIVGRHLFDVFPDNPGDVAATGASNLRASLERVLRLRRPDAMAVQKYDIRRRASEGGGFEERHWSPINSPVFDVAGEIRYIVHRVQDVTEFIRLKQRGQEQEQNAAELRDYAQRMELEVYSRAQQLQEVNQRLRDANEQLEQRKQVLLQQNERLRAMAEELGALAKLKSGFLANMSHELRTPLNAIIGLSELLFDGKLGPVSVEQRDFLGNILSSSQHLLQLVNDVLDLANLEAAGLELQPEPVAPAAIAAMAEEIRDILRQQAARKNIAMTIEIGENLGEVVIDPARLRQVLYNFVSNALKFTPDGGRVAIRLRSEKGEGFRLEVEDTGIGVKAADMERIFVDFEQLDGGTAKQYQGVGVGLALARRIVEAQGGRVGLTSVPGRGSTFYAVLPRRG